MAKSTMKGRRAQAKGKRTQAKGRRTQAKTLERYATEVMAEDEKAWVRETLARHAAKTDGVTTETVRRLARLGEG